MSLITTRRRRAMTTAGALVLLALAACGTDDAASEATTTATTTAPPSTSAVGTTAAPSTTSAATTPVSDRGGSRTVTHELGTSQIPADPQRVVVVDRRGTLAFLLELGIEPVGALDATWLFGQPFHPLIAAQAEAAGVAPIDSTDGPNVEQIAQLEPDLIIGNVRDMGETPDELAQIAPTIGLAWNFADPLANALAIGEALGRTDEAQALADRFESTLAAAAAEGPPPGTVSIIGLFATDDIRIYREQNLYGVVTQRLGGQIVPTEAELPYDAEDNEVNTVSLEQIGLAHGDRLISFVNLAADADAGYRELESDPLVQALPGFRNAQVLEADPQLAFGAAGVTGLTAMVDQLVAFFAR